MRATNAVAVIAVFCLLGAAAWASLHSSAANTPVSSVDDQTKLPKSVQGSINVQPSNAEGLTYDQTKTKQAIEDKLKDPETAEYRNVGAYHVPGAEGYAFCGEVNAKNGFGGYSGYERFVGVPNEAFLESEVTDFDTLWNKFCDPAQIGPPIWW